MLVMQVTDPPSGYFGIDISQIIFAGVIIVVLIGFAYWGWTTRQRVKKLEEAMRDYRDIEPEGFEEEPVTDPFSEGAMLDADDAVARNRDIAEHSS